MTIDKSKFLKTVGWTTVGVGLYLVGLSVAYSSDGETKKPVEDFIDAEFTILED